MIKESNRKLTFSNASGQCKLILALDVASSEAEGVIKELRPAIEIFKVGSRLFTEVGPKSVEWVHKQGGKVFLDLKFHDIPLTVVESCRNAVRMKVWGFTIHSSGGFAMMKEAAAITKRESEQLGIPKPLIFGVTVLTSISDSELKELGILRSALLQVKHLALLSKKAGLDGVVASGNEIETIRKSCGKDFLIAVPGIRTEVRPHYEDQRRVMDPKKACQFGANYLIMGRSILESKNKVHATKDILKEIERR